MNEQFKAYLNEKKVLIDEQLPLCIQKLDAPLKLKEAMEYSLKAGGKRLRPVLLFATLHAFNKDEMVGLDIACALEMVHTYSLIHDDLPSMDDDDLRRGLPTNHKVFGEATAILAGDALLTYSFELIASTQRSGISSEMKMDLVRLFAKASGSEGMVGGQIADLEGEGKNITLEQLEYIHEHKTGKLLQFPVIAGAILSEASDSQLHALKEFAKHLGLAFQIKDDILDVEGDESLIGKPVGSDIDKEKSTYPSLLTLEGAKKKCQDHLNLAKDSLYKANVNHGLLEKIANYIVDRNH